MEENNVMTKEQLQEDYSNVYVKKVHLIGRATMAIAFILMFAPVLYMHFVAGFTAPADAYMACAAAACAAGVGGWIAEPISYFPILGAAGTYMSYLAGNVGNTRVQWRCRAPRILTTAVPGDRWQRLSVWACPFSSV